MGKATDPGPGPDGHWRAVAAKFDEIAATEARSETYRADDAETCSWSRSGRPALFVERVVVDELRADGSPGRAVPAGHALAVPRRRRWPRPPERQRVLVFELNAGQMLDDVQAVRVTTASRCASSAA